MGARLTSRLLRTSLGFASLVLAGCYSGRIPPPRLDAATAAIRQHQTRVFADVREQELLAACGSTLQDMGFVIDESDTRLGVITASRGFPKKTTRNIAGLSDGALMTVAAVAVIGLVVAFPGPALAGVLSGSGPSSAPPPPQPEEIRVTLAISPASPDSADSLRVRVSFLLVSAQRSSDGTRIVLGQPIDAPKDYQRFFDKLAQVLSREFHQT